MLEKVARGGQGVGAAVLRTEDGRFLQGKGEYLADLQFPGMLEIAFLRSPVAHARLLGVAIPPELSGRVFLAADIAGRQADRRQQRGGRVQALRLPRAWRATRCASSARSIAICIGRTRAEAEDAAQAVEVELDLDELPAIWDIDVALQPGAPRVHEHWTDNVFLETRIAQGDLDAVKAACPVVARKSLRMARHAGVSLETRGVLALPDRRMQELVVYSSTQFPHVVRTMLADRLGIPESGLRVVAPDVGGGFGIKNNFNPEELAVAALALKLGRPLRWVEDRREHLIASPHAREHRYELAAYADADGRIRGIEATVIVDAGAYSVWPWTAAMEAGMSAGIMTGPYDIPVYHGRAVTVCTNKSPLGPYRGVGRSGACFAIETLVDEVARVAGRDAGGGAAAQSRCRRLRCRTGRRLGSFMTAGIIRRLAAGSSRRSGRRRSGSGRRAPRRMGG